MSGEEDWRKTADTHKMSSEQVKAAGVEGSKGKGGNVLHQRRSLPFSLSTMAVAGLLITGAVSKIIVKWRTLACLLGIQRLMLALFSKRRADLDLAAPNIVKAKDACLHR
ncbi:hypothetical protein Ahy_A06g030569 [Arachis hypogaea]|uniref:Uncharacterized protein n=1 Tax=Arachis hypogaea TaxID=3818 RepID=A0A445CWR6_ARAHY|nr:hypothetical protein Ahy_A06g030569 [Arachis hypogaea]